jgi:hypothetical protein
MKKLALILLGVLALITQGNAKTVTILGPSTACPGSTNIQYAASRDFDNNFWEGWSSLVFTISGGTFNLIPGVYGTLLSSDGHTFTIAGDGNNPSLLPIEYSSVNWDNANHIGTITATYNYSRFFIPFTATGSSSTIVGVVGQPGPLSSIPSICTGSTRQYPVTCPNTIAGTGANAYQWSGASGSTNSAVINSPASGNVYVGVQFVNTGCSPVAHSPSSNLTIARTASVPVGFPTFTYTGKGTSEVTFTFHPASLGYGTQISIDGGSTFLDNSIVYVIQGQRQVVLVRSSNDCGVGPVKAFTLIAPACPTCPARMIAPEKEAISELKIFPNPASDHLTVEIPATDQTVTVSIFDLSGQLVKSAEVLGGSTNNLDIQDLAKGMYVVRVLSKDGSFLNETHKVIVTR